MKDELVQSIQEAFISRSLTLSTAESCTGGGVAARLTKQAGASNYFVGGIVAYSNEIKETLLKVPKELIIQHGAVSEQVVAAMAKGLLSLTHTDYGLAISGIAGPAGGTPEKPVGTICAAIIKKGAEPYCWTFHLPGNREQVIKQAIEVILGCLAPYVST